MQQIWFHWFHRKDTILSFILSYRNNTCIHTSDLLRSRDGNWIYPTLVRTTNQAWGLPMEGSLTRITLVTRSGHSPCPLLIESQTCWSFPCGAAFPWHFWNYDCMWIVELLLEYCINYWPQCIILHLIFSTAERTSSSLAWIIYRQY